MLRRNPCWRSGWLFLMFCLAGVWGSIPGLVSAQVDVNESIDDRAMVRKFEKLANAMIEAGHFTENARLQEQLNWTNVAEPIDWPVHERGDALAGPELYERGSLATVLMAGTYKCGRCDKWHVRPATGFVVHPRGLAVTNHHVVKNDKNHTMVVMTRDGRVFGVREVLAASEANDVALVQLDMDADEPDLAWLPIGDREPVGGKVYVVSHPTRGFYSFSEGMVSRYVRGHSQENGQRRAVDRMLITADYAKGSSGGPVLNDRGEVVGIVSSTRSIYYNKEEGDPRNLQMVIKTTIPAATIRELAVPKPRPEPREERAEQAAAHTHVGEAQSSPKP